MANLPGDILPPNSEYPSCTEEDCLEKDTPNPTYQIVVGETDSFGSEYLPMCQSCFKKYKERLEEAGDTIGTCEWCDAKEVSLSPFRDSDEGLNGPVYEVCSNCIQRHNRRVIEDLEWLENQGRQLY